MLSELCLVSSGPHTRFPSKRVNIMTRLSRSLTFVHSNTSVNLQCSPSSGWKSLQKKELEIMLLSYDAHIRWFPSIKALTPRKLLDQIWMKDFAHCWRFYSCSLATAGPFLIGFQLYPQKPMEIKIDWNTAGFGLFWRIFNFEFWHITWKKINKALCANSM